MKIQQLIDPRFKEAIQRLMKEPLPIKAALKLKEVVQAIDVEILKYDTLYRELVGKHAARKEDGSMDVDPTNGLVNLRQESAPDFHKEATALRDLEVAVPTVSADEIGEHAKLTTDDAVTLHGVVV